MSQLRWGFLGAGWIADVMATDFAAAGINVAAVANRTLATANALAQKHQIQKVHQSFSDLVNDPEIDVIYVNTFNNLHLEHSLLAMNAGKHVLCEKPLAMNAGQAREFAAAARANGVFAMEAMWTRFVPVQVALFEYINSGVLGKAIHVMADYSEFSDPIKKPRLFAPEFGGGAIMDLGIYPLSFAARVLGIPNRVQNIAHLSGGVDISDSIALGFAGDRAALIHTSIAVAGFTNATIHLEGGRIQLGSPLYGETNFVAYNHKDEVVHQYQPVSVFGSGRAYQGLEVERCINAGLKESPIMSLDESVAILGVVDAIRQAAGVVFPGD